MGEGLWRGKEGHGSEGERIRGEGRMGESKVRSEEGDGRSVCRNRERDW